MKVHAIPSSSGSWRPSALIQPLSAVTTRAAARRTSIVSGKSQKPSRKPRTASLGGDASALGAADAVGDRRHHFAARLGQFCADDRAGEILVLLARPLVGENPTLALTPASPSITVAPVRLKQLRVFPSPVYEKVARRAG